MTNKKTVLYKKRFGVCLIGYAVLATLFALFIMPLLEQTNQASSLVFTSYLPDQEAVFMTAALFCFLGIFCISVEKK